MLIQQNLATETAEPCGPYARSPFVVLVPKNVQGANQFYHCLNTGA